MSVVHACGGVRAITDELASQRSRSMHLGEPVRWGTRGQHLLTWDAHAFAPRGASTRHHSWLLCPLIAHAIGWELRFPVVLPQPYEGDLLAVRGPTWFEVVDMLRAALQELAIGAEWLRHRLDGHLHWPAPLQSWLVERAASLRHADVEDAMPLAMILEVWVSAELARRAAIDAAADVAAAADSVAAACAAGW